MELPLQIAICEDLPEELARLRGILEQSKISHEIEYFASGETFLAGFQLHRYDLIFMDIYMGGMTGIETAAEVRKIDSKVAIVFTTSSLEYALESYRLGAMKYLEKPVTAQEVIPILQMVQMQKQYVPKLTLHTKPAETQVPLEDILFLEQNGAKFNTHLLSGKVITAVGKLDDVMSQLDETCFYHCHKSFIVNFTYVTGLNKDMLLFELIRGKRVFIHRDGFWRTKRAYEAFLFSDSARGATDA